MDPCVARLNVYYSQAAWRRGLATLDPGLLVALQGPHASDAGPSPKRAGLEQL
jgi:hypothetical protein